MTTSPAPAALAGELGIDAVFVLSVKTFADRIAHVTPRAGRFGIAFEFIFDFDAAELDDATIRQHFVAGGPPMKRQASLTLKHLQAWRLACARGARRIMVFEDDVVLHPDFHARLAAAMRAADALAPGWRDLSRRRRRQGAGRVLPRSRSAGAAASTTAEGYVATRGLPPPRRLVRGQQDRPAGRPADRPCRRRRAGRPVLADGTAGRAGQRDRPVRLVLDANRRKHDSTTWRATAGPNGAGAPCGGTGRARAMRCANTFSGERGRRFAAESRQNKRLAGRRAGKVENFRLPDYLRGLGEGLSNIR